MNNDFQWFKDHLQSQVLPFWETAFDDAYGGVFTCYTNDGKQRVSEDKFTWSQGRMLWCLSFLLGHAQCSEGIDDATLLQYRKRCDALFHLLNEKALLPGEDEVCAFLLDRKGNPKKTGSHDSLYTSMYADCFVIMGFARYALLVESQDIARTALGIYTKMQQVMARGIIRTEPYPLPPGTSAQSISMIICNTAHELALALQQLGIPEASRVRMDAQSAAHSVLQVFADNQTMQIREVVYQDTHKNMDLLARHRNPGHAIECMWFCLDALGDEYREVLSAFVLSSLELGWDKEWGGLFRYVDTDGGEPKGECDGSAFSQLVASTWELKLWWPHVEALYACSRFYQATKDERFFVWYERLKQYTYTTFPSDKGEEWIQIRTRIGIPLERVVALPVKDPYHILRMHLLMLNMKTDYSKEIDHEV
ncbi:AGE family epimerase/isomerase [Sphaerochaeta globosa]|uniref:N-acylglucosamine 2-epimerase n=1 Tax=Sphaerochaeta globosa (strain ATCC BAA-1886 / DSM 22777 / Buddy) TaxID=158189 RepID=F0RYM2_SPHGB|nr:AGE family epimerase/isomerase [Sphaerochaeta globosa]ADY12865.1 N-acylglucosamine 2-epimerase [Sphaerochaeta globosa str. Buddy]